MLHSGYGPVLCEGLERKTACQDAYYTCQLRADLAAGGQHATLKAVLKADNPSRVQKLETMLNELRAMTVLCNEEWSGILSSIQVLQT